MSIVDSSDRLFAGINDTMSDDILLFFRILMTKPEADVAYFYSLQGYLLWRCKMFPLVHWAVLVD